MTALKGRVLVTFFMITDLDIYRCAQLLLRQHGAEAPIFAAQRADERLAEGDIEGQSLWTRVLRAITELEQRELVDGERLN